MNKNNCHALLLATTILASCAAPAFAQTVPDGDLRTALAAAQAAVARAEEAASAARQAASAAQDAARAADQSRQLVVKLGGIPADFPASASPPVVVTAADGHPPVPSAAAAPNAPPARASFKAAGFDFGFNGYIRTSAAVNDKGGDQICFGLPGVNKYRYGNECETFSELQGSVGFPVMQTGIEAKYTLMLGYYSTGGTSIFGGSERTGFDVRQNWIGFTGFGGALDGATVWGGRRYYQRHDVHVQDFFYWSQRGQGAGIENIKTPVGLFSVALMHTYNDVGSSAVSFTNGASGNTLDLRLSKIASNPGGTLEFGAELRGTSTQGNARAKGGYLLTAEHNQTGIVGGFNRLTLQYGARAGATLSTNDPGAFFFTTDDTSSFRVIDQLLLEPSRGWSLFFVTTFQRTSDFRLNQRVIGRRDWFSAGSRIERHWSDYLTSTIDVGYDQLGFGSDPSGVLTDRTARLTKLTIAPVVFKLGRTFYDRPELRFFATCSRWNRSADLLAGESGGPATITGNSNYLGDRKGCSFGSQIEAWW